MMGIMERTTMDMDTTVNGINMDEDEISDIIKEILLIDVGDDIRFEFEKLEPIRETANIGQIPNREKLVATIRSREISGCLFLQAKSQLKSIYKDNADTIIGNMDSQLFIGGTEPTTLKDLSQALGKEIIEMYSTGESRGNNPSYSMNYKKTGKDLMTIDELAVMDGDKCILQLRGVRPFMSDKYDITQHPLYKETGEYDDRNKLDIQNYVHHTLKASVGEVFDVVKI